MDISTMITLPYFVYSIYANAANRLGNVKTEGVLSAGLTAYAKYLLEDMIEKGKISIDKEQTLNNHFKEIM